ncbi:MAG: hypothetical protein DSY58_08365, partial [Desulfobulbus sp.]
SVASFLHKKHLLRTRCKCGEQFIIQLDFRKHYRKTTRLPGTYRIVKPAGGGGGVIHIQNISLGGIGFTVSGVHNLQKKQILQIDFRLNDKNQSKLTKQAEVCIINKNTIGCKFLDSQPMERSLGFFLRP